MVLSDEVTHIGSLGMNVAELGFEASGLAPMFLTTMVAVS